MEWEESDPISEEDIQNIIWCAGRFAQALRENTPGAWAAWYGSLNTRIEKLIEKKEHKLLSDKNRENKALRYLRSIRNVMAFEDSFVGYVKIGDRKRKIDYYTDDKTAREMILELCVEYINFLELDVEEFIKDIRLNI